MFYSIPNHLNRLDILRVTQTRVINAQMYLQPQKPPSLIAAPCQICTIFEWESALRPTDEAAVAFEISHITWTVVIVYVVFGLETFLPRPIYCYLSPM